MCAAGILADFSPPLHESLKKHLLPIYEDLSREDLLQRCLSGHTQNANENFNSTVWLRTPKNLHSGLKIVEIASSLVAGKFSGGYSPILWVMNELEIQIGIRWQIFVANLDRDCMVRQNRSSFLQRKEARLARKEELLQHNLIFDEAGELLYTLRLAD